MVVLRFVSLRLQMVAAGRKVFIPEISAEAGSFNTSKRP
jgi:hypothetical protein